MKKRALLYSPYLDIMGGGERHILSIMKVLAENGFAVDIAWDNPKILSECEKKFNMKFENFKVIPNFITASSRFMRTAQTSEYDVFMYVTDGSYFPSRARKNIIFAMYPEKNLFQRFPWNWLTLRNYDIIANGDFTAEYVGKWLHKNATILYPAISDSFFVHKKTTEKTITILTVGRIFEHLHSKRQDIVIQAFKKLKRAVGGDKKLQLNIVGGLKDEDREYYNKLLRLADGDPSIQFHLNAPLKDVKTFYEESTFYWHAAGFGVNERKNPTSVEHFGITPLEAMASRCAVFCHNSGGPKRYIEDGITGTLYSSIDELVLKTVKLIEDSEQRHRITDAGAHFVQDHFSQKVFEQSVRAYFNL